MNELFLQLRIFFYSLSGPVFIIRVSNGKISLAKGFVKNSFISDCSEILDQNNIKSGIVYAAKGPYGKPVLHASSEIPKDILQQLRNTWNYQ
ncbi:MAG: DUF3634 family protein [Ferruginibacter sp.]